MYVGAGVYFSLWKRYYKMSSIKVSQGTGECKDLSNPIGINLLSIFCNSCLKRKITCHGAYVLLWVKNVGHMSYSETGTKIKSRTQSQTATDIT